MEPDVGRPNVRNVAKDFFRCLPVSQREEQWGLYVAAGGLNAIEPGSHYPQAGQPCEYVFSCPFQFSNAFKQKTGMSPSRWRQQGLSAEGE